MAKSVKTLDDFSGGLNLRSDAKDLEDNQFAEARNISNVAGGKLTQSGSLHGTSFIPSSTNAFTAQDTDDSSHHNQGYGLMSFNMDTAWMDEIKVYFDDDFDTDDWDDSTSGGVGKSGYSSGDDNYVLATGTGSTNYGGIRINKPSLFADGDLCYVYLGITDASTDHTDTELGKIFIDLGGSQAFVSPNMNPENWASSNTAIQFVAKWGSDDDYITIRYYNGGGTLSKTITIDNFSIKKIPTTGSNNTAICTGTGKVVLASAINDALYDGSSRFAEFKTSNGIMGSTFNDPKVDISFDNGILKVQNKNEIMQWAQVDRTRTLVGGTSTVRNIEQVNYGSGSGYTISGTYAMDFPKFTTDSPVDKANTSGVTTLLNPKFLGDPSNNIHYTNSNPSYGVEVEFNNGAGGTAILADGSITKTWYLGASLLLDDEMQETEIVWESNYLTVSGSYMPDVKMLIRYAPFHGREMWDPRVTGFRIWMSETSAGGGDPLQLIECNFINMTYSIYGSSHLNYSLAMAGERINHLKPNIAGDTAVQLDTLPAIKFSELKGYLASEAIYATGKTSAIVGANRYLGNFTQAGVTYEDQIIKSDVLSHDIFPSNNFIEVAPNDGDEIVSLMSFGEELIVFKKRTMYVLSGADTADVSEISLESDYPGLGIQQASQACETEKGIAWINGAGLYLYDGDVSNLSETQMTEGTLRIKDDNTFDSLDESLGIAIGYDIEDKKLVYSTGSDNRNCMIYDFKTETFHPLYGVYGGSGCNQSNFVNSTSIGSNKTYLLYGSQSNGSENMDMFHYDNGPVSSGTGTGTAAKFLYVTKDMSFGNPTTRKKVIGVYVTYKAGATTNVIPVYAVDSSRPTDWSGALKFNSTTSLFIDGDKSAALESADKTFKTTASAWRTAYLKPAAAINNIYTFQFAMISNDTVPATFEINDITVVYREKSQK